MCAVSSAQVLSLTNRNVVVVCIYRSNRADVQLSDKFALIALAVAETSMKGTQFHSLWSERKSEITPYKLPVSVIDKLPEYEHDDVDSSSYDVNNQLKRLNDKYRRLAIKQARMLLLVAFLVLIVGALLGILAADRIYGLRPIIDFAEDFTKVNVLKMNTG